MKASRNKQTFAKTKRHKLDRNVPWSEAEDQLVRDAALAGRLVADLRDELPHRSVEAIKQRLTSIRTHLGLNQRQKNGSSNVHGTMLDPDDHGIGDPSLAARLTAVANASAQLLAAIQRAYPEGCPQ